MTVQNFGKIVNIASTAAFQPITNFAVYAATKAYVLSFSEAIAVELKSKNISVTAICPGATDSNFMDSAGVKKISMLSIASPKQVAEFTYRAVNKEKIVAIHGFLNRLIVVAIRFTPRSIVRKLSGSFFDN
jgi:short-subunit dehydrogenase